MTLQCFVRSEQATASHLTSRRFEMSGTTRVMTSTTSHTTWILGNTDEKTSRLHATYFPITNFPCCVQSLICSPRLLLGLRGRRMDLRFSPASSVVSSAGTWWAGFWNSGHPSFFQEFQCSSRYNRMWHDNPQQHVQITKVTAQFWETSIAQLVQSLVQRINDKLGFDFW